MPGILLLQHASLWDGYGGVEYYLDDLSRVATQVLGRENFAALLPAPRRPVADRGYRVLTSARTRIPILSKISRRYSLRFIRNALNALDKQRPDLILCGHVSLAPVAWLLKQLSGVPYDVIAYGIDVWGHLLPQDEWALRRADGILSISHWTKQVLVERGFSPEKIQIFHPFLPDYFCGRPIVERPVRERVTLLTVSRLDASERYKGHEEVMRALKTLGGRAGDTPIDYYIVGSGNDEASLRNLASVLGLQDTVHFFPALSRREDLLEVYRKADLFIMPSSFGRIRNAWKGEGFGIVYAEAAALGIPSIAFDCGGATDIIVHEKTGLLPPQGEIEPLAESIKRLVADRDLRLRMGAAAHAHINALFTERAAMGTFRRWLLERFGKASSSSHTTDSDHVRTNRSDSRLGADHTNDLTDAAR